MAYLQMMYSSCESAFLIIIPEATARSQQGENLRRAMWCKSGKGCGFSRGGNEFNCKTNWV